ncbi:histidine kinase [Fibrella sp. HMF5335]|uniref:Histidine kinase n=1 Tax=Fibrella rubiginis TaxID=2817060 RepID=A0A939K6Y4_9BACT|nr:sensor histidine kinase [Fibrella rubiginis]MBO0938050.1 histidine kinase [Fibrella rubiginis]
MNRQQIPHLWLLCLWGWLVLPNTVDAEPLLPPARFRIDHISVANGLTQGSVYYIIDDSRGFMWFGTQDGLNCYDGHRFRTYRPSDHRAGQIRGVNIFGIIEDPTGDLWVGTEEGLNHYDRKHDRFTCYYARAPKPGARPTPCRTLPFYANATELLYLSDDEGLVRVDLSRRMKRILNASLKPKHEYDLQSSTVRTAAGDVWLHSPSGLVRYNLASRRLFHYFSNHPDNAFGPPRTVFSFHIDKDDIAWIGTATGLIRFDHRAGVARSYAVAGTTPISPIYSLSEDQNERLWLGTQQQGILYFDKRTRLFGNAEASVSNTRLLRLFEINKIMVDRQGLIWANVDPNGVVKLVPDAFVFGGVMKDSRVDTDKNASRLSNYTVRGFAEYAANASDKVMLQPPLWVATELGINVMNQQTGQLMRQYMTNHPRSQLPMHNLVKQLYVDPYNRMWVGSIGGAYLFHPRTDSFELFPFLPAGTTDADIAENYARNLVSISADTLLAATEDGIYQLSLARRGWQKMPYLANDNLFAFRWDAQRRQLWVGTYLNGFVCYALPPPGSSAPWRRLMSGLPGYTVLHIHDDPAHNAVWISTDRGLTMLDRRTNRLITYTERDGLANAFVYGVLPDKNNNLWMSTNRGISRFDLDTHHFKNFDLSDGLQGLEFNGNALLKTRDGLLLFGGVNGYNSCRPELYRSVRSNPPVYFYNLRVNEESFQPDAPISEAKEIALTSAQNTFSLEFSAVDYQSNTHNLYAYRLTGYDTDWVKAGEKNYVRYANVPPGDYVLEVKAANKDGHWSNRIQRLAIHISPPFWRTFPFLISLISALGGLAVYWVRHREDQLRRQQADQLRLAFDVQEQAKKDIARDLHDEIGTRLATLKLYTTQLARFAGDEETPRNLRNAINGLINDTISDVRDLLRELNPRTLAQYGFGPALEELLERIGGTGAIHTSLVLDAALSRLPADTELMLYRIVQELINNTLKHANASQIDISCRYWEDRIQLTYADNGQGFVYERVRQGLGIGNIESRVAMLKGTIQWQAATDKGTSVLILVPLPYADGTPRRTQTSIKIPSVSN